MESNTVAKEKENSYEGRLRQEAWMLCKYLLRNTNEFPSHKSHLLQKSEEFFIRIQFDNVIMLYQHDRLQRTKKRVILKIPMM